MNLRSGHLIHRQCSQGMVARIIQKLSGVLDWIRLSCPDSGIWLGKSRKHTSVKIRKCYIVEQRHPRCPKLILLQIIRRIDGVNPIESLCIGGFAKLIGLGCRNNKVVVQIFIAVHLFPNLVELVLGGSTTRNHSFKRIHGLLGQGKKPDYLRALNCFVKFYIFQHLEVRRLKGEEFHYTDLRTLSHRATASCLNLSTTASGWSLVWNRIVSLGTRG